MSILEQPEPTVASRPRYELGQYFTPQAVADFMASLFDANWREVRLVDAGAGMGSLTASVVRRLCSVGRRPALIDVTAYELDRSVIGRLRESLADCHRLCEQAGVAFRASVREEDFIGSVLPAVRGEMFASELPRFNAAIVNPPYRKIRSDSGARSQLSSAGIETTNLYTGFLALVARLFAPGGELVAITPRSFCNGPYYRPFREDFLSLMSLRRLHVFDSRSAAFRGDDVLQENLILHAVKNGPPSPTIILSSSSGKPGAAVHERVVPSIEVVGPDDPEKFIHVTLNDAQAQARAVLSRLTTPLAALGLAVSTGRVVDFRARQFLRQEPGNDTVPLIYPCHFKSGRVRWPLRDSRKPNAIVSDESTRDLLVPSGIYLLTKRFTSKEERRRVVACVCEPDGMPAPLLGFENHLNYFHATGAGLTVDLARGLATFLNSTVVDVYFRQFNGHTQVNATDLRSLKYPTRRMLERLGRRFPEGGLSQEKLDGGVEEELDGE